MDSTGKVIMESILETKASTILEFFAGLHGTLSVTLEEGAWAAWLYDLLKPPVANVVVCNPRKNALPWHSDSHARFARVPAEIQTAIWIGCGQCICRDIRSKTAPSGSSHSARSFSAISFLVKICSLPTWYCVPSITPIERSTIASEENWVFGMDRKSMKPFEI
jgi:hypothetical protein